jgi:hypothetical protein
MEAIALTSRIFLRQGGETISRKPIPYDTPSEVEVLPLPTTRLTALFK